MGGLSPRSRGVKALWDRLLFRNSVLCRRWENDVGDQITNQVVFPDTIPETAFEAHHSHTTASHRGVLKTINALQSRYYWPELTSEVCRLIAICHVCGSKRIWGKKRRSPLKQYVVGAPMERIAVDILDILKLRVKTSLYWWLVIISLNGLRTTQYQTKRQLRLQRS